MMKRTPPSLLIVLLVILGAGCAGKHKDKESALAGSNSLPVTGQTQGGSTNAAPPIVRQTTGTNVLFYQWRRNTNLTDGEEAE